MPQRGQLPPDGKDLAAKRLRVIEAYLAAAERRFEIVAAAGDASDREHARDAVARILGVDDDLAEAVLELRISRFTRASVDELRAERARLRAGVGL